MQPGMATGPGGVPFTITRLPDDASGHPRHKFELGGDTGTHLDAPAYFADGKRTVQQIPPQELLVPVMVINVQAKVKDNPDYQISTDDIVDWEAIHGTLPYATLVLANTGWHTRFRDPQGYLNQDAEGEMHFPGFSREAAELLLERDVAGIGIDTPSVDPGTSKDFAVHHTILGANKYQLENLTNLDALPETGAKVVLAVLPIVDGTQAQARVLALIPETDRPPVDPDPRP